MPKKRVTFPVYVQAIYDGELDVPDGIESYEEIEKYIKKRKVMNRIGLCFLCFRR